MHIIQLLIMIILYLLPMAASASNQKPVLGQCQNLDSYLFYCQKFNCSMKLPVPNADVTMNMLVLGEQEKKCQYQIKVSILAGKEVVPFQVATKCSLSEAGKTEAVKEFQSYKNGNVSIYMQSTQNPILRKECVNE